MKTKKTKEGISLIVLVLTIVIMIILAGVIIINLNNSGIIDRAKTAVSETNLKSVQELANVAWGEAYLEIEGEKTAALLEEKMLEKLKGKGMTDDELAKYTFTVTTGGVEVAVKNGSEEETPDDDGTDQVTYSTMGELVTSALDYGKTINYESTNGVTDWKVFYHTDEYVYLITSENISEDKLSEDLPDVNDLTGDEGDTELISSWLYNDAYWEDFKNEEKYGDNIVWVSGAPALEMFANSWNAKRELLDNKEEFDILTIVGGELYANGATEDEETYGMSLDVSQDLDDLYENVAVFSSGNPEGEAIMWIKESCRFYGDYVSSLASRPVICLKAATPARPGTDADTTYFVLKEN